MSDQFEGEVPRVATIEQGGMWSLGHFTYVPVPERNLLAEDMFTSVFQPWLHERVRALSDLHVRTPEHPWSMSKYSSNNWHEDGAAHRYLGTWSNTIGTEIMLGRERDFNPYFGVTRTAEEGQIYQPEPFEVVLFDNRSFVHRIPNGYKRMSPEVQNRWFVRFSTNSAVLDHPDVRECVL